MRRACRLEPWFFLRFTLGGVVPVGTTRPMASLNSSQVSSLGARASPLVTRRSDPGGGLNVTFGRAGSLLAISIAAPADRSEPGWAGEPRVAQPASPVCPSGVD